MSAVLDSHTRYIRNIESDLQRDLVETSKEKRIPRTTIDAFGATVQEAFEKSTTSTVCIGGDCTKVRSRLTYSNDYGSHIIGSTLALDACEEEAIIIVE
jgi:hypothetical protein